MTPYTIRSSELLLNIQFVATECWIVSDVSPKHFVSKNEDNSRLLPLIDKHIIFSAGNNPILLPRWVMRPLLPCIYFHQRNGKQEPCNQLRQPNEIGCQLCITAVRYDHKRYNYKCGIKECNGWIDYFSYEEGQRICNDCIKHNVTGMDKCKTEKCENRVAAQFNQFCEKCTNQINERLKYEHDNPDWNKEWRDRPFQTVEIKGDQKDSLAFVIGALKTTSGQKITVKEAESSPKKKGTFYYLSVTPRDNDTYLHPLFKDTYWHVLEYITIKDTLREESYERELFEESDEGDAFFEPASIEESYESRPAFIHACSYESRPASRPAPTISDDVKKIMMYNIEKVIERGQRLDTISYGYAAEVTTGEHVDTRSNFTSFQYLYDVSSNQSGKLCCVSLSIAPALVHGTLLTKSEIIELAKNDFTIREQGVTKSLMEEMIKKGIFKEDVCVVCQEDIPPNVILYRCGHQCLHKTCIGPQTRCPMCRSPIVASIDASLAPN